MTAATRPSPSKATRDKAARLATDIARPIVVDVDEPAVPAFAGLVPSSVPGSPERYHVTYGPALGWRCTHPHWSGGVCAHLMACWLLLEDRAGWETWAGLVDTWLNRTEETS